MSIYRFKKRSFKCNSNRQIQPYSVFYLKLWVLTLVIHIISPENPNHKKKEKEHSVESEPCAPEYRGFCHLRHTHWSSGANMVCIALILQMLNWLLFTNGNICKNFWMHFSIFQYFCLFNYNVHCLIYAYSITFFKFYSLCFIEKML